MQKGIKTSEFWVTVLSPVLAAVLPMVIPESQQSLIAQIGSVLISLGYVLSRTAVKTVEAKADAAKTISAPSVAVVAPLVTPLVADDQKKSS